MKFLVLFYTTFIVQCMAAKSSDAESYLPGIASASGWSGCIKRFYILIFLIPGVVLYYIPESRYYARKACHVIIDVVANGLKAALSGSFSDHTCANVGPERFPNRPETRNPITVANGQKDHLNPSQARRKHRIVKQDSKSDEDKIRGHDKRRHRHTERSKHVRDEKNRNTQHHQSQSLPKTTAKDAPHFCPDKLTEGFYYPETRCDDACPKYSTSFVISGAKTSSNRQESAVDLEEEEHQQTTVSKQRSRPGRRPRPEDAIFSDNEGPTRDCESFVLTELDRERRCDVESKIGFSTADLDHPERECDVPSHKDQPHHEDSATSFQDCDDGAEDWESGELNGRASVRSDDVEVKSSEIEAGEGNRTKATFPARRVNFEKNQREKCRKKISEDEDNRAPHTNSEEVLGQLGDQIRKLEKTIRMMRPDVNRNQRGHRNGEDYAVQNIEAVLKDMKRSFNEVDERIKRRRLDAREAKDLCENSYSEGRTITREDSESVTSVTADEDRCKVEGSSSGVRPRKERTGNEVLEEDSLTSLTSETLLDDEDEVVPIVTNRVKPYLVQTFDWFFTGCPGVSTDGKYSVGKNGASKPAAE